MLLLLTLTARTHFSCAVTPLRRRPNDGFPVLFDIVSKWITLAMSITCEPRRAATHLMPISDYSQHAHHTHVLLSISVSPGSESPNSGLLQRPVASCTQLAMKLAAVLPPAREPAHTQNSARVICISSLPVVGKRRASSAGCRSNLSPSHCSQAAMCDACQVLGSVGR